MEPRETRVTESEEHLVMSEVRSHPAQPPLSRYTYASFSRQGETATFTQATDRRDGYGE